MIVPESVKRNQHDDYLTIENVIKYYEYEEALAKIKLNKRMNILLGITLTYVSCVIAHHGTELFIKKTGFVPLLKR